MTGRPRKDGHFQSLIATKAARVCLAARGKPVLEFGLGRAQGVDGDLAWLSVEARKILDEAGFPNAVIVASNDLDEHIIASLKEQGAMINVWGVGTKLVMAYDPPALGGVYKLGAVRGDDGRWVYEVELSKQSAKISTPGIQQVRRFRSVTCTLRSAGSALDLRFARMPGWRTSLAQR